MNARYGLERRGRGNVRQPLQQINICTLLTLCPLSPARCEVGWVVPTWATGTPVSTSCYFVKAFYCPAPEVESRW